MKAMRLTCFLLGVVLGCAGTRSDSIYPDASALLSARVDLSTSISGRVPGFDVVLSSNPAVPGKRSGRAGVTDLLATADQRATITVFSTDSEAEAHFDWECRGMSAYTSAASVRVVSIADGASCAIPYTLMRSDAHGLWAPLGYHAAVAVRRGRLVVAARETVEKLPIASTDGLTLILEAVASAVGD